MTDYIVNSECGENVIKTADKDTMKRGFKRRMLAYYTAMMSPYIQSKLDDSAKMNLLVKIAGTLTEEEISQRIAQMKDEKKKAGFISVLQELVEAYEDDDPEEYEDLEVNGNKFTYKKGLDVSPFLGLFTNIGNDTKGNKWMVEIDSEGKAVLHE